MTRKTKSGGWVIQHGSGLTSDGLRPSVSIVRVVEAPGKHVWITLAKKDGTPMTWSNGKPCIMALPDHAKQTVYATKAEAIRESRKVND